MQNKIDIPGTTISLEIIDKIITVTNKIRTHCPVCDSKIGLFDEYFNSYGFCCVPCGYEYYGIER